MLAALLIMENSKIIFVVSINFNKNADIICALESLNQICNQILLKSKYFHENHHYYIHMGNSHCRKNGGKIGNDVYDVNVYETSHLVFNVNKISANVELDAQNISTITKNVYHAALIC